MSTSAGQRADNQDATCIDVAPTVAVLAVADGAGGQPDGQRAASLAVNGIRSRLRQQVDPLDALLGLDLWLSPVLRNHPRLHPDAATAVAVAVIRHGRLYATNIGDCRVTLTDAGGTMRAATTDGDGITRWLRQRHAAQPTAVAPAAAGSQLLARVPSLGAARPTVLVHDLTPGDRIILTSDGVHDTLAPEHLALEATCTDAQVAAGRITAAAVARGSRDNVTAIIATYNPLRERG